MEYEPRPGDVWMSTKKWICSEQGETLTLLRRTTAIEFEDNSKYPHARSIDVWEIAMVRGNGHVRIIQKKCETVIDWPNRANDQFFRVA